MLLTSIYPFLTKFSILPKAKLTSYTYFVASRASNRDVSQILLFGKEINLSNIQTREQKKKK